MKKDRIKYVTISTLTFLVILCSGMLLGKFAGRNGLNLKQSQVEKIESEKPEIFLIGNSMLDSRIDPEKFEDLTGKKTGIFAHGGSASAIWYLYLKNVYSESDWKPPVVILFFRDHYLTDPEFRVHGTYRRIILKLGNDDEKVLDELSYSSFRFQTPQIIASLKYDRDSFKAALVNRVYFHVRQIVPETPDTNDTTAEAAMNRLFQDQNLIPEIVNRRQLEAESMQDISNYNFADKVESSYLPQIIELVNNGGSDLILVRVKRRRDLQSDQQPEELLKYIEDLYQYFEDNQVTVIDFTYDNRIVAEHYSDGDHLSEDIGKPYFTEIFAEEYLNSYSTLSR